MKFSPKEVLFSPTTKCNLDCPHCGVTRSEGILPVKTALRFLSECKKTGIRRVGFTGGEPFLAIDFLCAVTRRAVAEGMLFDTVMTNGAWYKNEADMKGSLMKLRMAGYDGNICVSVDSFHGQDPEKMAGFIKAVSDIWKRSDMVSVAYVSGARDSATEHILRGLARVLKARLVNFKTGGARIANKSLFIKARRVNLSSAPQASGLKPAWDGRWFKEDYCAGPGNIFFVLPDGSVKPCCGYANESGHLTIGNMKRDSAKDIIRKAGNNVFVRAAFTLGLSRLRKRMKGRGFKFPGKTSDNCYFCHYLLTSFPADAIKKCLD